MLLVSILNNKSGHYHFKYRNMMKKVLDHIKSGYLLGSTFVGIGAPNFFKRSKWNHNMLQVVGAKVEIYWVYMIDTVCNMSSYKVELKYDCM